MASNRALGGANVESGVEVCLLTLFHWAAEAFLGPLPDITFDMGPYESSGNEALGGPHAWM